MTATTTTRPRLTLTHLPVPVRPVQATTSTIPTQTRPTPRPDYAWAPEEALHQAVYAAADRLHDTGLADRVRAAEDHHTHVWQRAGQAETILRAGVERAVELLTAGMVHAAEAVLWAETRRAESLLGEGGAQ